MGWTNYPNGVSLTTAQGTVNGMLNATSITLNTNTATAAGTITVGTVSATGAIIGGTFSPTSISMSTVTSNVFIGERAYLTFSFTSAATTAGVIPLPFSGQVIDCWTTCDTTPRTCSAFTLYSGNSASGTVCVASVALAFATAINQQVQPTLTAAAAITATALAFVVTTAGTAANFYGVVTIQRTA